MAEKTAPNPLVAGFKKIPGLSILLPTKGLLYNSDEVAESVRNSGEVHIYPMGVKDELVLKSPDLLLSGEGFNAVVQRCIPEILKPLELYQPDVDAILVGIRIATYGEELSVRVDNPYYDSKLKGSAEELDYVINLSPVLSQSIFVNSRKDFTVTLENKQVVTMSPLRYRNAVKIIQDDFADFNKDEKKGTVDKRLKLFEETMLSMILEVDGITDLDQIKEWLEILPVSIFKAITEKVDYMSTLGPDLTTTVKDPITDKSWKIALPINPADFFAFGPSKVTVAGFLNTQNN